MKYKFKFFPNKNITELHLDVVPSVELVNQISQVDGVIEANNYTFNRYMIVIKKGELFNWHTIQSSIVALLKY